MPGSALNASSSLIILSLLTSVLARPSAVEAREGTEVSPLYVVGEWPGSSESTEFPLEREFGTARKL